jgi:hypothetical protein
VFFLGTLYAIGIAGHMSYSALREGIRKKERLAKLKESGQLEDVNAAADLINPNLKMVWLFLSFRVLVSHLFSIFTEFVLVILVFTL